MSFLKADLHSHSLYSNCGMHTVMELLNHARDIGLSVLAITDHGSASGGRLWAIPHPLLKFRY